MIVLCTDFGLHGPYTGQVKAVLEELATGVPVIDLFADLPAQNPKAAAYLLAAYDDYFPAETVFIGVVDPGVGSSRRAVCLRVGNQWYVGPDNGLFEIVQRRGDAEIEAYEIVWRPARLSVSFHGRDLFAPVAARLAVGETLATPDFHRLVDGPTRISAWPDDLYEVVYLDIYGNAITGIRKSAFNPDGSLYIDGKLAPRAETFSSVSPGQVFCYENANGLMEIAVNQGSAGTELGLKIGMAVTQTNM